MKRLLIFMMLPLLAVDCIPKHIYIHNLSRNSIYYTFGYHYPDTSLIQLNLSSLKEEGKLIKPNKSRQLNIEEWGDMLKKCPSDTLMIFFFDANIIENNSVEEITKGYNILKRQNFTSEWTLFTRRIFYKKSNQTIP